MSGFQEKEKSPYGNFLQTTKNLNCSFFITTHIRSMWPFPWCTGVAVYMQLHQATPISWCLESKRVTSSALWDKSDGTPICNVIQQKNLDGLLFPAKSFIMGGSPCVVDLMSKNFPSSGGGGFSATKTKVALNCLKWIDPMSKNFPSCWGGGGWLFCHKNQSCSKLPEVDRSDVKKFSILPQKPKLLQIAWSGWGGGVFSATKTKVAQNCLKWIDLMSKNFPPGPWRKGRKEGGGGFSAHFSGIIIFSLELYLGDQLCSKCTNKSFVSYSVRYRPIKIIS